MAKRTLYTSAAEVEKDDVERLVGRKREFEKKLEHVPGRLRKFINQVKLLFELIQDWWSEEYEEVPWLSISFAVAAVIYFINPFDLIPDIIPVVGYLDDAGVVGLAIIAIEEDLKDYCRWKGYKLSQYF